MNFKTSFDLYRDLHMIVFDKHKVSHRFILAGWTYLTRNVFRSQINLFNYIIIVQLVITSEMLRSDILRCNTWPYTGDIRLLNSCLSRSIPCAAQRNLDCPSACGHSPPPFPAVSGSDRTPNIQTRSSTETDSRPQVSPRVLRLPL